MARTSYATGSAPSPMHATPMPIARSRSAVGPAPRGAPGDPMSGRAVQVVAAIGVVLLLCWGAPFFVPLFLALFISNALSPVVSGLTRVVRWRVLAAGIVVTSLFALIGVAAWSW